VQGSPIVRSDPPRWQVPHLATDDRVLAGVAGGVARELGVDPVVVRVGFVVLAAAGGIGLVLYAVLWIVMRQHAERHAGEAYVPQP
jgi:phage shock protein PspC (stress-responsive transcriptional regulator)